MKNKINKIYCLGSSFTAGGGFEFDSFRMSSKFKQLYEGLEEEMTPYNFSYPGQLKKLVGNDIEVINIAKQGNGNDRTERLLYNIVNKKGFNKDTTLFLLEFTALGRDEFFCNFLNDYIICNYKVMDDNVFSYSATARDYFYQSKEEENILKDYDKFFETLITKFKNLDDEVEKLHRNNEFLLAYLDLNNINYLFTSPPPVTLNAYDESKCIIYGDDNYFVKTNSFIDFFDKNKLSIKDETFGINQDGHAGFKSNKLTANIIFNDLIDRNILDFNKKEIDWKYYYELQVIKKDRLLL